MTARDPSREDRRDQDRWLRARTDLVVSSLPLVIIINPVWAALFLIPFGGSLPVFGRIDLRVLLAIVGVHLANSLLAYLVCRWAATRRPPALTVLRALLALQLVIAFSWSGGAALCWIDGNGANNTLVALIVIANMWALAITRSHHPLLFAAGIAPLMLVLWLRAFFGEGEAAQLFSVFTPIFAAYAWFMGTSARDRVNQLLRARFELEDMAQALEAARSDAVAKGAEAQAASASKSAFVANMSHELRTPLNAILGFAEIIEQRSMGPEVSDQYRNYAVDIHESGLHLLSLINDMLDIAKIEAGKMEIERRFIDIEAEVETAVRLMRQRCEAKAQTISVVVDEGLRLLADERAFKQILLNLLSNAAKFSPDGGAILVRCAGGASGSVRVSVEDSGPGIPPDKLNQLFKPFSQVDNRYDRLAGGTGLGLSLVRGLIALHGGRGWVENRAAGAGLIACVEFPAPQHPLLAA